MRACRGACREVSVRVCDGACREGLGFAEKTLNHLAYTVPYLNGFLLFSHNY